MNSEVVIRRALKSDLDTIGELWQEFMDFHKDRDLHLARSGDGHERFKEFIAGHMELETSCVLSAETHGNVVGYCLSSLAKNPPVFESLDYGTVLDLAVTSRFRRNGIGEKLYRSAEAWFRSLHIDRIEIRVVV
ncbi:hypothetical protein CSA56_07355, partial [candidate division KSB3 bacterium]